MWKVILIKQQTFLNFTENLIMSLFILINIQIKKVLYLRWNERHLKAYFETLRTIQDRFSLISEKILGFVSNRNMVSEENICPENSNKLSDDVLRY